MKPSIALAALLLSAGTAPALAAVSATEAARLGADLTPLGAEAGANSDGSIPAWNPGGVPVPAAFVPGSDNYLNPWPDDKPLYSIDGDNWQQYREVLTEGSQAMFKKLGQHGFRMDVYPTRRAYETPDWYYANTRWLRPTVSWSRCNPNSSRSRGCHSSC